MHLLTPMRKQQTLAALRDAVAALDGAPTQTPCAACDHFANGFCRHWNAPVPAEAQASGCDAFEESIPF